MLDNLKRYYGIRPTQQLWHHFSLRNEALVHMDVFFWFLNPYLTYKVHVWQPPPYIQRHLLISYMYPRSKDLNMQLGLYPQGLGGHTVNLYLYQFYALCLSL